jgi:hypothetical protein
VNGRVRKILDPAGMVEIEMADDDVANVLAAMAQRLDLADRRILLAKADAVQRAKEFRDALIGLAVRVIDILQAVTGVDQHEAVAIRLDQQAMADEVAEHAFAAPVEQRAPDRAIGAAIEMVNAHRPASLWSSPLNTGEAAKVRCASAKREAGRLWGAPRLSIRFY